MIEWICNGATAPRCKKMFLATLGILAVLTSLPAQAGESCVERDVMVERLQHSYSETLAGGGLHSEQKAVELWASNETGSFTLISTDANGMSCIIATGTNWQGATAQAAPVQIKL